MKIGADAINTPVKPDGTVRSPYVMSRNGAAIALNPSRKATPGRRRISLTTDIAAPPCILMSTSSATVANAVRAKTIGGSGRSRSAYLMSR